MTVGRGAAQTARKLMDKVRKINKRSKTRRRGGVGASLATKARKMRKSYK